MGNQKLKWTSDEEEALRAGIEKHGAGKWKNILRDPYFSDHLINRSNIDLKDKWRNLCVAPGTQFVKEKARTTTKVKEEGVTVAPTSTTTTTPPPYANNSSSSSPATSLQRSASSDFGVDNFVVDNKNAPRYDAMIFEAISELGDANGSDVGSIFSFIEPRHDVPPTFRRVLSSRLRRLAAQGKLSKVSNSKPLLNFYKLPDGTTRTTTPTPRLKETNVKPRQSYSQPPSVSQQMIDEAAITAACKVVEAENNINVAKVAVEELEKTTKLADEADLLLELAKEMHEQCCRGEVVVLA
ncbi:Telomere repeat-binding factor 5 [Hirschfeldia incana]|nr:Telomere repeat-binding factor 5 [Hirschfeldia incana]